jgi:hypothetical protein
MLGLLPELIEQIGLSVHGVKPSAVTRLSQCPA